MYSCTNSWEAVGGSLIYFPVLDVDPYVSDFETWFLFIDKWFEMPHFLRNSFFSNMFFNLISWWIFKNFQTYVKNTVNY